MANGGAPASSAAASKEEKNRQLGVQFKAQHALVVAFFTLILFFHALGIYLFCSGFLLSRLVLQDRSECAIPPIDLAPNSGHAPGSHDAGCWHPKTFDKAVVILIDALRYDFTVPFAAQLEHGNDKSAHFFHDAFSTMYDTAVREPHNAFLRPFIADPPTTTLQRLKGLTTGTLPTFIDAGANFAGTAIDEDNLIEQLYLAGKRVVHLGDDTWQSLFPGYFEPNLTRPYDSFNVPDLHTVDNGVTEHLFPLLQLPELQGRWDVVIGHYLGVDHAGHRYGPNHPEMAAKLRQMDGVINRAVEALDENTLLVVMGDHGMDAKGDHGGESDDEVEAALWMYSKKGVFGRTQAAFAQPPAVAKQRPVGQIDLVPTLALLLGMPIPFNNLGKPIEEAFAGRAGSNWKNLAEVNRLTSAQIHRYQGEYARARNLDNSTTARLESTWDMAGKTWKPESWKLTSGSWRSSYDAFAKYQEDNLNVCRSLWARFDLVSMGMGIAALSGTFVILGLYSQAVQGDRAAITPGLFLWALIGTVVGGAAGAGGGMLPDTTFLQLTAFGAAMGGITATMLAFYAARNIMTVPYPKTFWGGLCTLVTLMLCVGFAANSFTVWEDEQLLFFLTTFGVLMLVSSLGQANPDDRNLGTMHSLSFLVATRVSSLSRLCREEQMPNCTPTYYASATSSTSAAWQLAIPLTVAILLPSAIRHVFVRSKNYQGSAVIWIGIALRIGLVMTAGFWFLDVADDGNWYPSISKYKLETAKITVAQVILAVAFAAGYSTYIMASPFLLVKTEQGPASTAAPSQSQPSSTSKPLNNSDPNAPILTTISSNPTPPSQRSKLLILGYHNAHGTRYFLLPSIWVLALLLVQKPMGQGSLALCCISILNILEIADANSLTASRGPQSLSPMAPTLLALLATFHFFKTGHQAALASIQWDVAFLTARQVSYTVGPALVALNTYGPFILCALAVPAVPLWKSRPRNPRLLGAVAAALATHLLFYAAIAVASVVENAWLRRHLMLYRVFMPRMLLAITALLVVELVGVLGALLGVRVAIVSVADVFGWEAAAEA